MNNLGPRNRIGELVYFNGLRPALWGVRLWLMAQIFTDYKQLERTSE